MQQCLNIAALPDIGEVSEGASLPELIVDAARRQSVEFQRHTVVVVAQKIVSKSEGRVVYLDEVRPSQAARELAAVTGKEPALVELILAESTDVLRAREGVLIVRHRLGFVLANAGIDQSNVKSPGGRAVCLLLPQDPDGSAKKIRSGLGDLLGISPAVIVSDSFGRAWRRGTVNVAIGSDGLPALIDMRGLQDRYGRILRSSEVAFADSLAAAAGIVMGEAQESTPVVMVQGARWSAADADASCLIRPLSEDLFQ